MDYHSLFIGGDWVAPSSTRRIPVISANTEDAIGSVPEAQEEIFGPVLSVIAYADDDDAVRIANDSEYGLGGTVWTSDPERGLGVAKRIHTGTIGVNTYLPYPAAPFGGVKASGVGRELGPEGLANYRQLQSVYLR